MLVFGEKGKPENYLSQKSREPTNSIHVWQHVGKKLNTATKYQQWDKRKDGSTENHFISIIVIIITIIIIIITRK